MRSGVTERDPDHDDSIGVVVLDKSEGNVSLLRPAGRPFVSGRVYVEGRGRRPSEQYGGRRGQEAALTEGTHDEAELACGNEFLGGLQQEHGALDH